MNELYLELTKYEYLIRMAATDLYYFNWHKHWLWEETPFYYNSFSKRLQK